MGEFFLSYGLFLAKILTVFVFLVAVVVLVTSLGGRGRRERGSINVVSINEQLNQGARCCIPWYWILLISKIR